MKGNQLKVEQLQAHLASIIASAEDGIVSLDTDGVVITWNDGAERLFGFSAAEMLGRPYSDIVHNEALADYSKLFKAAMSGKCVSHHETRRPRRDGTTRQVSLNTAPIFGRDGTVVGESTFLHDITERKSRESELAANVAMLERAQRVGHIGVWTAGLAAGSPVTCSSETLRIFGLSQDWDVTKADFYERVHPEDLEDVRNSVNCAKANARPFELEYRIVHPDGSLRWVFEAADVTLNAAGVPSEMTGVVQDVTARHMSEEKSLGDEHHLRLLADHARDLIFSYRVGPPSEFEYVSPASLAITGYTPDELYQDPDLVFHLIAASLEEDWVEKLLSHNEYTGDLEVTRKDGSRLWANQQLIAVRDPSGELIAVEGITRDISDRKEAELRLSFEILHDALTGLANQTLLMDRIEQGLVRAAMVDKPLALFFVNLDRFKLINDAGGHARGDAVLTAVAQRLTGRARLAATVARFSGDSFVVLCEDVYSEGDATRIAENLLESFRATFDIQGVEVNVSASIGVALATLGGQSGADLLRNADLAMYRAKARGRGRYEFYDDSFRTEAEYRSVTEAALRRAIEHREFRIAFQPVWSIAEDRFVGAEALIRWPDPIRGPIRPDDFISVAEDSGLIVQIGGWVLEQACAELARWALAGPSLASCTLSVNVSAIQLRSRSFVESLAQLTAAMGINPELLCLEITESVLMEDIDFFSTVLHRLRDVGVSVSIDDFGTGYSSLAYLRRFPVNELKIDQTFVEGLGRDAFDATLVRAVVMIGNELGIRVVAEGVETATQLATLSDLGAGYAQGYLFARPCDLEECRTLLSRGSPSWPARSREARPTG